MLPFRGATLMNLGRTILRAFLAAAALSLALLANVTPSFAQQDDEDWVISFAGGFAKPAGGAFGHEWRRGPSIMLGVARQVNPKFELGAEFGSNKFHPAGDSIHVPGIGPGQNEWDMWRLRLRGRRMFASPDAKIAPFVMAGLGLYPITVQSEDSTGIFKITLTGTGVSLGGGVDFRAGESVAFGLESQYHYVKVNSAEVGYKASPILEFILAIRWVPGGGT